MSDAFDLDFDTLPAAADADGTSFPVVAQQEEPAGSSSTWTCADCDLAIMTATAEGMDEALEHWRTCPKPSRGTLRRREANGLDPNVIPLSPSALKDWERCKRRWWFAKVAPDRIRTDSGVAADLGTAIHHYAETGDPNPPAMLPLELHDDWEWMKRVIDRFKTPPLDAEAAVFEELMMAWYYDLEDGRRVLFQAKTDKAWLYADGSAVIDDYKTGRKLPSDDELDSDPQMMAYPVGLLYEFPEFPFRRIKARLGDIRGGNWKETDWLEVEKVRSYDKLLREKAIEVANEKLFRPTPGPHCFYCDFAHKCNAGQLYLGEAGFQITILKAPAQLDNDEAAAAAYAAMVQGKAALKKLTEAVNQYARKTPEGIPLEDGFYREILVDKMRLSDKQQAWAALEDLYGKKAWDYFNFDHRKGGAMLEDGGVLADFRYTFRDRDTLFVPNKKTK